MQLGILDDASIAADSLIGDLIATHLAPVLDLDELDVRDKAQHFDNMADDLVGGDRLNELNLIVGLKVGHLVLDLPNDLEVVAAEHNLHIDVN